MGADAIGGMECIPGSPIDGVRLVIMIEAQHILPLQQTGITDFDPTFDDRPACAADHL